MTIDNSMIAAILLSCDSFESFFGAVLELDREKYLKTYRNDWAWYYAKGFMENGITPILYIPSLQYQGAYDTDAGVRVRFVPLARWYRLVAPFRRALRITRWSMYVQERLNAAAFIKPLQNALQADNANILYVQEYWGGRFDHLAYRVSVPIFAVDQGGVAHCVVKWFKRSSFQRAAMLYSQSPDECLDVERYGGQTTLQPNGGDTSFFVPPPGDTVRSTTIVTVARLTDKQKRTSDLIRAMALLPEKWTLDIIGTGPDRAMLEDLAIKLGVNSRVKFLGFKSQVEVRRSIQQCGVYAMPSANEAMCLAVLEAMSCGAAVVASRIRTFESLIRDDVNGRLFPVGDLRALAAAIEEAWQRREILGAAASASVIEKYNSKTLYRQLAESLRAHAKIQVLRRSNDLQPGGGS